MRKTKFQIMTVIATLLLSFGSFTNTKAAPAAAMPEHQLALAGSNIYYVSTSGKDTNSGSAAAPFKTFSKAASVLAAGDTLQVLAGTYNETLTLSKSGTAAAPITVIGNGAILNMQASKANGISITGSYIKVSNFEIIGAVDFGILVAGKYVVVENNNVHDTVTKNGVGTCGLSTSWGSAVKVKVGGENSIIRNNTVYNNCGEGIAVTRGVIALVENNTAYDNFNVNYYVDNSPWVVVQNNLSYCTGTHLRNGNRATGIALGEEFYTGWGAQLHDVTITGNTVRDCQNGIVAFASNVGGTLTNATISNNSVPSGQVRSISMQASTNKNVVVSYNNVFNTVYVKQTSGISLVGNVISDTTIPTSTPTPGTTLGVFRPGDGQLYLKSTHTAGVADMIINYGASGDYPVTGDWDGNGTDTIGVYRNGTFYLRNSNSVGYADLTFQFGAIGDQPVVGDWDGDGIDTIGVYRKGLFFLRDSNSAGAPDTSFALGNPGDIGVTGDWNGDGMDTTGVFRPSNGVIFLKNANTSGFADVALNYGLSGDKPVIGDWNDDGIDTIGVFRNGSFYLRNSNTIGFADIVFAFGSGSDIPIAGDWDGMQ